MKRTILRLTITSLMATTAFADPIHDAAKHGNLAGVQVELDKGVDVNEVDRGFYNLTPLHWAKSKGVAELLISEGADVMRLHWKDRLLCILQLGMVARKLPNS